MYRDLDVEGFAKTVPKRARDLRQHTHGYVEDFRESLMRKRPMQIELKIAQFRFEFDFPAA
jgi:hypothetical protein